MKIAFILPALANKGPIVVARDIINVLVKEGHVIDVFFFDEKNEIALDASSSRKITMKETIPFDEYDIVHSHGLRPDYYIWKHRRHIRTKCCTTMHNYIHEDLKFQYNQLVATLFGFLWTRFLKKQDHVFVLSNHMKQYYTRWISADKIEVIYNGRSFPDIGSALRQDELAKLEKLKKEFIVLGVIAQLTKRKGIDQAIKILPQLPGYCLLVVGDGKEKEQLERLAEQYKVEDRCIFWGYHKNGSLFMSLIDIYLMLSRSEGFPLSLIEAASQGIPTVCSGIPIFKEVFTQQEVTFFELENEQSLFQAITSINYLRDTYSQKISQFYQNRLTAEIMGNNYLLAYKRLAAVN
ncbi:glycosyltransferase family 4 protein [Chitinophaga sp. XS-30]|uniref:glycosyltransferase family 4 protein n=1 Tax=Chitinophaga sp. XS-30 TaxID=2604421 RepID=UPI0011DD82CC|nr:glycosyltransferase family 4 protein [Chitinophaga sp. XS-30]QEH39761.1 glycosyltransferase family 4 protein [Chitinophaga sp. XS-30]